MPLAAAIGVQAAALRSTAQPSQLLCMQRPEHGFGRGDSVYDDQHTDPAVLPGSSCAVPLWLPPNHAFRIVPRDGTKGGMRTDARAAGAAGGRVGHSGAVRRR